MMDLRRMNISSPSELFRPIFSRYDGEFSHRFRFHFEKYARECPSKIISDFLLAEYDLRVALQLRDGEKEDRNNEGMRDGINTKYARCKRNLSFKKAALPYLTLEAMRRSVFNHFKWYMRDSLTSQCVSTGGCCGQACGCCEKRKMPLKDMSEHSTWVCRCCIERKGLNFKNYDGDGFEKQYKDALESDNPVFLLEMADSYFLEPKSPPPLNPEFNSECGGHIQSNLEDASANDDANQGSATSRISDSRPPPYKEVAKDNGERKEKRLWKWMRS